MSPDLVLLLCVVFILYLFREDMKRDYRPSSALWLPLIWFMIMASRPVALWFITGHEESVSDLSTGNAIDRTIFSALMLFGAIVLFRRKIDWHSIFSNNRWVLYLLLYCGVSLFWSDYFMIAGKRWFRAAGLVIMILIVLTELNPVEAVRTLVRRMAYVLVPLSIVFIKYFREIGVTFDPWGQGAMYVGITNNKNTLGRVCLVAGVFLLWDMITILRKKKSPLVYRELSVPVVLLLMIAWLFIKADSATALGSFIVCTAVFFGLGLPVARRNLKNLDLIMLVVVILVVVLQLTLNLTEIVVMLLGRDTTLTGRVQLWKDILAMGQSSLVGTGYESFWLGNRLELLWDKYWWRPTEAHNGYLEIYLELGAIGLFLWAGVLVSVYRNARKTLDSDFDWGRMRIAIFVMMLIYNITESAFQLTAMMWFVFLLVEADYQKTAALTAADRQAAGPRLILQRRRQLQGGPSVS